MLVQVRRRLLLPATIGALAINTPAFAQTGQPAIQPVGDPPEGWSRRGDTGVRPIGDGMFAFGIQYRVVYDGSNLPGPGGTTPDDPAGYDFFRQRVRLNFEFAPTDSVGAFVQAEFRGGWGGSAPGVSDPRDSSSCRASISLRSSSEHHTNSLFNRGTSPLLISQHSFCAVRQ